MKRLNAVLYGATLLLAGCALPLGEDYLLTRDGSDVASITGYNLQEYVPIPRTGEQPVTAVDTLELEMRVVWKDEGGAEIPLPFDRFAPGVYQAEIRAAAKDGYAFYPSVPFAYPEGRIRAQNDDLGTPDRIIRVTYNNADEADKIFITDYNLQSYVPVPLAGEEPVRSLSRGGVEVTVDWNPSPAGPFELGTVYGADIRLSAPDPYRFFQGRYFEYPAGTVTAQPGYDDGSGERNLTVTYKAAGRGAKVNDLNLTHYIPKPVNGVMGAAFFTGPQYTGTVSWEPSAGPFQSGTAYTAEVSLTPVPGYSFTGAGPFVHTGAETVTTTAGGVRIGFSAAPSAGGAAVIDDTDLTGRIPLPVSGGSPVTGITGTQYTGAVSWTPAPHGTFQYGTVYTAVLTLQAAPGYTFAGIGRDAFRHGDAPGAVTNAAGSGTVRIAFPPAASATYLVISSFAEAGDEGSALKLMREKKANNSLTIDLPGDAEVVDPDQAALAAGENSPANVIINGHGQELTIGGQGTLLTVGRGVALTLRNITLSGRSGNNAPLVTVQRGGRLTLGDGVILTGNESTGAGGVWVNGGELVLNPGAEITGMTALRGGGVLIDTSGTLFMNGGIIAGNTASGENGGGGVLIMDGGTFTMADGTIESNRALGKSSGGGVLAAGGGYDVAFNMFGGTIGSNHALDESSGGGVLLTGEYSDTVSFNMFGGTIESNHAEAESSGGGVGVLASGTGTFNLYEGTIRGNTALGTESGGGVFIDSYNGRFNMYGGTIGGGAGGANTAASGGNGVCVINAFFTMYGGTIQGNGGYGVLCRYYNESAFTMMGAARIDEDVSLTLSSPYNPALIVIGGDLSGTPAANIIVPSPTAGTYLIKASSSELITRNYQKLKFNGSTLSDIDIEYDGYQYYYGRYK
jgi:hypothetical protein